MKINVAHLDGNFLDDLVTVVMDANITWKRFSEVNIPGKKKTYIKNYDYKLATRM